MKLNTAEFNTGDTTWHGNIMVNQAVALMSDYVARRSIERASEVSTEKILEVLGGEILYHDNDDSWIVRVHDDSMQKEAIFEVDHREANWDIKIYASTVEFAESWFVTLKAALVPMEKKVGTSSFTFRYLTSNGEPTYITRRLQTPLWEDVRQNYPANLAQKLDGVISTQLTEVETGGRLILFHSSPGTGKTSFIRAIGNVWSEWAELSYIVDPEAFFGRPYYMVDVMSAHSDEDKWHLIVVEDAGEYLKKDAAAETGQGLSRLLNLTDGLIGQGTKAIILMTTNEPIAELHEAVNREGRCLANIAFDKFSSDEANIWLKEHEVDFRTTTEMSLADLYAAHNSSSQIKQDRREFTPGGYA